MRPQRNLVFDLNDFDETLEGPGEWDLKRLAASFTIAARHNELDRNESRTTVDADDVRKRDSSERDLQLYVSDSA